MSAPTGAVPVVRRGPGRVAGHHLLPTRTPGGAAQCACGLTSLPAATTAHARRWHRDHRARAIRLLAAGCCPAHNGWIHDLDVPCEVAGQQPCDRCVDQPYAHPRAVECGDAIDAHCARLLGGALKEERP